MRLKLLLGLALSLIFAPAAQAVEPTEVRLVLSCKNINLTHSMDTQWQKYAAGPLVFQTNPSGSLNDYEIEVKRIDARVELSGHRMLGASGTRETLRGVATEKDGRYVGSGDIVRARGRSAIGCDFTADFR